MSISNSARKLVYAAALAGIAPFAAECQKGSGGAALKGNAAVRAAALSSYQSLGAGSGYPFAALRAASPEGGAPLGGSSSPLGTASLPTTTLSPADSPGGGGGLTLVPGLGLYAADASFSGDVVTLAFFSDSAGTQSAGSVTITLPPSSNGSVAYTSYPDLVKVAINITGGNVPSVGNLAINFTGASGANTLTGSVTVKSAIKLDLDLTLSDAYDVGGTIKVTQNGELMKCTGVSGNVMGTLTCNLTVSPYGWTGSGMFSLITGSMLMSIDTGNGMASAVSDGAGGLQLGYADGTSESVPNADSAPLVGSSGGGSDGGAPMDAGAHDLGKVTASYTLTAQAFRSVQQINNLGQILGTSSPGGSSTSVFAASPSAMGVLLGDSNTGASAMNNVGHIVGNSSKTVQGVYWAMPTDTPAVLDSTNFMSTAAYAISDADVIVGTAQPDQSTVQAIYWATPTSSPAPLPGASSYGNATTITCSSDGRIVASFSAFDGTATILYWSSATAAPMVLPSMPGVGYLVNSKGQILSISNSIGSCNGPNYLASPTSQPVNLASDIGSSFCPYSITLGINSSGLIVGEAAFQSDSFVFGSVWTGGQLVNLTFALPTGSPGVASAVAVNDSGQIVAKPGANLLDGGPNDDTPFLIITLN